jgi:hypothetical protein
VDFFTAYRSVDVLLQLKQAAAKEVLEDNYAQIESEYERALWMLYAIADDVIQEGNPYSEQDVKTISGCKCPRSSRYLCS